MKYIVLILVTICFSNHFAQQFAQLDNTFNGNGQFSQDFGFNDNIQEVIVQNDQKIVSVGTTLNAAFAGNLTVMRLNQNGELDNSFATNGIFKVTSYQESYAYRCLQKADGKLIIAGAFADPNYRFSILLMQLNEDGTLDVNFGINGVVELTLGTGDSFAYSLDLQNDGKIVIGGTMIDDQFRNEPILVRFEQNGTLDNSFGMNGVSHIPVGEADNKINNLKIQTDGKIVAIGHLGKPITGDGQFDFDIFVCRVNVDGNFDLTFSGDGITTIPVPSGSQDYVEDAFALALKNDGKIIVGGYTTNDDFSFDAILLQVNADGTIDLNYGANGIYLFDRAIQDVFYDIKMSSDGSIFATGTSGGFFFDDRDFLLINILENGTINTNFNSNGYFLTSFFESFEEATSIAIQNDGKILLAGKASNGNNNDAVITRISLENTNSIDKKGNYNDFVIYPNPLKSGEIQLPNSLSNIVIRDVNSKVILNFEKSTNVVVNRKDFLDPGIYFVQIDSQIYKLIVE